MIYRPHNSILRSFKPILSPNKLQTFKDSNLVERQYLPLLSVLKEYEYPYEFMLL